MRMVKSYHQSGLSQKAFCRRHGVPLTTFQYWLKKANRLSNLQQPPAFQEVKIAMTEATAEIRWAMEIVSPSGMTIRCREALSIDDLSLILRGGQC